MARGILVLALTLVLVACGSSAGIAPNASPTSTVRITPSPTGIGPTPIGLSCRLPVSSGINPTGFVSLPSGTFTPDPSAPAGGSQVYDWAVHRWLPGDVFPWAVSPNGLRYAVSVHPGSGIRIGDAPSGAERIFAVPPEALPGPGTGWRIVGFTQDGVYLVQGPLLHGLWLLDPDTGESRRIAAPDGVGLVVDGVAWLWLQPDRVYNMGFHQIARYELDTGRQETWLERSDAPLQLEGFDDIGRPLISAYLGSSAYELLRLDAPGSSEVLFKSSSVDLGGPLMVVSDTHGLWMESGIPAPPGMWLYSELDGLRQIVRIDHYSLAGGCQ